MGKPKKETVRKLRGLMILDQMEDYTPLHKLPDYPTTEKAFRHFFADMMGMGKVINWKDML